MNKRDDYGLEELQQKSPRHQLEIINRVIHTKEHLIGPRPTSGTTLFQQTSTTPRLPHLSQKSDEHPPINLHRRSYRTMLQLILTAVTNDTDYTALLSDSETTDNTTTNMHANTTNALTSIPTMEDFAKQLCEKESVELDEKQYIAYEAICATFLLNLVTDGGDDTTLLGNYLSDTIPDATSDEIKDVIEELKARGGNAQLIMFLSGPAGAGKTKAVKTAEKFCYHFCKAVGSLWHDTTFLFTAYTGSAASDSDGVTICKIGYINKGGDLTLEDKLKWKHVKILIVDEISFMQDNELIRLDRRLKECRDRTKVFGGISIIFAGDFRQLEPAGAADSDLLFSRMSSQIFENNLNAVVFLDNIHRFKDDPEYGEMLKRMWFDDLTKKDREKINTRVIGKNGVELPPSIDGLNVSYACPTNKERNVIHAAHFKQHVEQTLPNVNSNTDPPEHTIVVEAEITSSKSSRSKTKINHVLKNRIITTCGDDNVKAGNTHVDPALCLYVGAFLMCVIDNKDLNQKVRRGNGTMCRVIGISLKRDAMSYKWKNYYNHKVWTVNAKDVESIEVERFPKSRFASLLEKRIMKVQAKITNETCNNKMRKHNRKLNRLQHALSKENAKHRFTLQPRNYTTRVKVKPHPYSKTNTEFTCRMTQLPVNLNDATTGHKLQGMSKDTIIITSWPTMGLFKNWEYVVLSRVRTLSGLYLFKAIDMDKSFKPSGELKQFFRRAQIKERRFINNRKKRLQKLKEKRDQRQLLGRDIFF